MSQLAIIATIQVQPGTREAVLAALLSHRDRCLRDEPGTLQFEVLVPKEDDAKLMLYEVYADAAAFEAHWNGPSIKRAREQAGSNVLSMTGIQCAVGAEHSRAVTS